MDSVQDVGRGTSAAFAACLAAGVAAMLVFAGIATDATRGYMVFAKLSDALDATAQAGEFILFGPEPVGDPEGELRPYFEASYPLGFMDATVEGPTVTTDAAGGLYMVTATAAVPTTFLHVVGIDTVRVSSESAVTRPGR